MSKTGGRISWTREDRARAKKEKGFLFAIAIDGVSLGEGSLSYMGVGDKALATEITKLIIKLAKLDGGISSRPTSGSVRRSSGK